MFQIDDPTAAASEPAAGAAGTPGWFQEGSPGVTPATLIRASWLNMVQDELKNVLAAASITPVKGTNNQVITAILALIADAAEPAATTSVAGILKLATLALTVAGTDNATAVTPADLAGAIQGGGYLYGTDSSGTANTVTVALTPSLAAYAAGMSMRVMVANTNTGASTINVNGRGAKTIQWNGRALVGGELVAGQIVRLVYDGTYFQIEGLGCIQGGSPSAWWKIYADGTIEQGGYVVGPFTEGDVTVTLPVPFPNEYRGVVGTTYNNPDVASADYWVKAQTKPATGSFSSIVVYINSGTGGPDVDGFSWLATGR